MRRRWVGTPGSATSWQTNNKDLTSSDILCHRVSAFLHFPFRGVAQDVARGVSREVVSALVRTSRRSRQVDEPEPEPGGRHARARESRERSIAGGEGFLVSARRESRATVGSPTGPGGGHTTCEQQDRSV